MATSDEPEPEAVRVGQALSAWRKAAQLSQEQAAVYLGMTMITFQRWERGTSQPALPDIRRMAELYGRDWRELGSDSPREANFRALAPFKLLVHPAATVDPALLLKAQATIDELNEESQRRALKSSPARASPPSPSKPRGRNNRIVRGRNLSAPPGAGCPFLYSKMTH